jgi:UDPglucose--hexose-1-phosphate uridylyltransferase
MELRKDPITMSWVIFENSDVARANGSGCLLCPGHESLSTVIYSVPYGNPDWQVRVIPHLHPLYRIEGDAMRRGEGLYDKMRNLGAHEIVVETPQHDLPLSRQTPESIAQVLRAYVARIRDLKQDRRFKYITVFRNQGEAAGQDLAHPHSEITATPFVPRRMRYELGATQRHFELKERCVICDIVKQELAQEVRAVASDDRFVAFCPFASRVPYETWVLPVYHHCCFEQDLDSWDSQLRLARFIKSVLLRIESVTPAYHLVLHSAPNTNAKFEQTGVWKTLSEDYHWHFEILPVVASKSKSYSLKEVYYNSLTPEEAAKELRTVAVHQSA